MIGSAPSLRHRHVERGGVSWVTLVLLAAVAGGSYLAWVWGPIYLENYEVKAIVRDFMNQAIKNPDDETLKRLMVGRIRTLGTVDGVDRYGQPARLPAVDVDERQVSWERDRNATPPTLRVSFEYERLVRYPHLDRVETKAFVVDETNDMTPANWGK